MITKQDLILSSITGRVQNVLTTEQATELAKRNGTIITVTLTGLGMDGLGEHDQAWFFTDSHLFGYPHLSDSFVPCSAAFPMRVTPREGLESGLIATVEDYIKIFHDGERQITAVDEVVDIANQIEQKRKRKPKLDKKAQLKYDPAFFPEGTVVEVQTARTGLKTFTVDEVYRNGANSYVLGMKETYVSGGGVWRYAFHVNLVSRIVKRGDGPLLILQDQLQQTLQSSQFDGFSKKGHYAQHPIEVLTVLIANHCKVGNACVDFERMQEMFHKRLGKQSGHPSCFFYNKKKAKKWVKQNYNRFLISPTTVEQKYQEDMSSVLDNFY